MYYDPAATGERIQTLRKNREVTQEQFAVDLNISDRYMRNCERIAAQNGVGAATVKRAEKICQRRGRSGRCGPRCKRG